MKSVTFTKLVNYSINVNGLTIGSAEEGPFTLVVPADVYTTLQAYVAAGLIAISSAVDVDSINGVSSVQIVGTDINPVCSILTGSNVSVGDDKTATWADSAAKDTVVDVAVVAPVPVQHSGNYVVHIFNPSTVSALTVTFQTVLLAFGGATRYSAVSTAAVAANTTKSCAVSGWMLGGSGNIVLSNDTILGEGEGFAAKIRVTKI